MPASTLAVVIGAWILFAGLTYLAYRFNSGRAEDD